MGYLAIFIKAERFSSGIRLSIITSENGVDYAKVGIFSSERLVF